MPAESHSHLQWRRGVGVKTQGHIYRSLVSTLEMKVGKAPYLGGVAVGLKKEVDVSLVIKISITRHKASA